MAGEDQQPPHARLPKPKDPALVELLKAIAECIPGTYLVGGALRDLMRPRARPIRDLDLLVMADAAGAAASLARRLDAKPFALDPDRGQYRVTAAPSTGVATVDISASGPSLEENLVQRDFTVNALAAPILPDGSLGEIVDVCDGLQDLAAGILRLVSDDSLDRDPLRLLRAGRLAAELELSFAEETRKAIAERAHLLRGVAAERQKDELTRILATPRAARALHQLDSVGLLSQLLPEMEPARGVSQPGRHHYWDVFEHSMEALANLDMLLAPMADVGEESREMRQIFDEILGPFSLREYFEAFVGAERRLVLTKFAGLLHDVAKPETKTEENGAIHFYGHSEKGAQKAVAICSRLRFSNRDADFVALLVDEHLRPTQLSSGGPPSSRALYRFFRDLGEAAAACLTLMLADGAAAAGPRLKRDAWIRSVGYAGYLLERNAGQMESRPGEMRLITGTDLMEELALEPGPLVGAIKRAVDEAIGSGEIGSREEALAYARRRLGELDEGAKP